MHNYKNKEGKLEDYYARIKTKVSTNCTWAKYKEGERLEFKCGEGNLGSYCGLKLIKKNNGSNFE
jgi:hypothetical protein